MTESLYKVTDAAGRACHGGSHAYDLPDGDVPGAWTPDTEPDLCESGWHVTTDPMCWAKVGMRVFEVEARDVSDEREADKRVARSVRLTRERPELVPTWWHDVVARRGGTTWRRSS